MKISEINYTILNEKEFPSTSTTWEPLEYHEWVTRSFLTAILKPEWFIKQFYHLISFDQFSQESTTEEFGAVHLNPLLTAFRLTHHFSGNISSQPEKNPVTKKVPENGKVACFLLNPRYDTHYKYEYYRILSQFSEVMWKDPSSYSDVDLHPSKFDEQRLLDQVITNPEQLCEYYWEDENNRFTRIQPLLTYLKREKKQLKIEVPTHISYRGILNRASEIAQNKESLDGNPWNNAINNVIAIDILPIMSKQWQVAESLALIPYFIQTLYACEVFNESVKTLLFAGKIYQQIFHYIKHSRYDKNFPWRIEEINPVKGLKDFFQIKIEDNKNCPFSLSQYNIFCSHFRPAAQKTTKEAILSRII